MANVKEQDIINKLATHFASISGIQNAYPFAQNPNSLNQAQLPAVVFFPESFDSDHTGHPGLFTNKITIKALVFIAPMQSRGGRLKFLENEAMPYLQKIRNTFQTRSVVNDLLSLGLTKAWLSRGVYGAGGNLLSFNRISYIGVVCDFNFFEKTGC